MGARLILELPRDIVDSRIIEGAALHIAGEMELLHRTHVLIEVIGADFIREEVDVAEEELNVLPLVPLPHVKMEPRNTAEILE